MFSINANDHLGSMERDAALALASLCSSPVRSIKWPTSAFPSGASPPGGDSAEMDDTTASRASRKRKRTVEAQSPRKRANTTNTQAGSKKSFTSEYYGVSFHKSSGRWAVQIRTGVRLPRPGVDYRVGCIGCLYRLRARCGLFRS